MCPFLQGWMKIDHATQPTSNPETASAKTTARKFLR
jgi:hypothetical protein